jgi:hypothetical protein
MTTQSATGPLVIFKPEGADVRKTYFISTAAGYFHANWDNINAAFSTTTGHDHDGTDSKTIPNGSLALTWTAWTPTITQGVAVTNTPTAANYMALGKLAVLHAHLAVTSTGTTANDIIIGGIPAAIAPSVYSANVCVGSAMVLDNAAAIYAGSVIAYSATTMRIAINAGAYLGSSPAFGLASGDYVSLTAMWQIT